MTRILTRFATCVFAFMLLLGVLAVVPSTGTFTQLAEAATTSAAEKAATTDANTSTDSTGAPYVRDEYGLYDKADTEAMESTAESLAANYDIAVYLLVVDDINDENVREFAKDYYIANDLGYGQEESGILFLIAVDSRDYVTITYGKGTLYYTDHEIGVLEDRVTSYLSGGEWLDAAQAYYEEAARPLSFYAENGEPLDIDNDPDVAAGDAIINTLTDILFIILIPGVIAGSYCIHNYRKMKTARKQTEADDYVSNGGLRLTGKSDRYLWTEHIVVPIPKDEGSGGGSTIDSGGFGGSSGGKF